MLSRTMQSLYRNDGGHAASPKRQGFHNDDAYILDGHDAFIDDDIERVLGRKARDFTSYARDAATAGAWSR